MTNNELRVHEAAALLFTESRPRYSRSVLDSLDEVQISKLKPKPNTTRIDEIRTQALRGQYMRETPEWLTLDADFVPEHSSFATQVEALKPEWKKAHRERKMIEEFGRDV